MKTQHSNHSQKNRGLNLLPMLCMCLLLGSPGLAEAQTNCAPRPPGLVAWWPGDGTALDVAGTNHATLQNGAAYASGKVGTAFKLDGVDDQVAVPNSVNLNLTNAVTMAAWIKSSGTPSYSGIVKKFSSSYSGYQMGLNNDGTIRADFGYGSGYFTAFHYQPVMDGAWHHVTATFDGTNAFVYVDGLQGPVTSRTNSLAANTDPLIMGNDTCCSGRRFNGLIDEISLYNRALAPGEIAPIYAAGSAGICYTNDPAPVFVVQPTSQMNYLLTSVTLTAAAMGEPRPQYQWLFNGAPLAKATNATLVLNNFNTNQAGDYALVASNVFGAATSTVAVLTLAEPVPGASWDASSEFSLASNPNGVWSYGRRWSENGDSFDLCSYRYQNTFWLLGYGLWAPSIQAGPNLWSGANNNGYTVVRWTCPQSGHYNIEGRFIGADSRCVDNWVYVIIGGSPVFSGRVQAYQQVVPYSTRAVPLERNAYIDLEVRWTGSGSSDCNWTVLNATITRVDPQVFSNPEPFENGWGDWYTDGSRQWQVRRPGNGPVNAYSGTNAACANLGGNYAAGASSRLVSPRFYVPQVTPEQLLVLRFSQWYQYGTGDAGYLQLSRWNGSGWDAWTTIDTPAPAGSSGGWQSYSVDLSGYQGQQVRVAFYHTANSDGSVGAGWYIDDVELSGFVPSPMSLGQAVTGTLTNGGRVFYVLNAPPGGHLNVTLTGPAGSQTELYVRRGALPSAGAYDYRFSNPGQANQSVFVPDAQAGPWYVEVYGGSIPTAGAFTLQANFFSGIVLTGLTPTHSGNAGAASIDIQGAGFDSTAQVSLSGGSTRAATNVTLVSSSHLIADIDLTAVPAGAYQLTVSQGTNTAALPFQVSQAVGPQLVTHLTVPSQLGRHAPATIYVQYANVGDTAMPAPLLVLTGSQHPFMMPMVRLASGTLQSGFWTSARPAGWTETIQVLAYGQTPGLLQPGESNTIAVAYAGLQEPWDFTQGSVQFGLGVMTVTNTTPVDWASYKTNMQPSSIPNDAWDALWANFVADAGATWGDYVRMLNRNATYLRGIGLDVKDLSGLLGFAFAQADSLNVLRTLASSTDASVPAPGLSLSFSRFFPQSIYGRYRLGALGRGWTHNWEISLGEAGDGTVTVTGPVGSQRVFQPDSRTAGAYFSQAGDHGVLTKSGGTFTLTEPRGLMRVFSSNGKLAYAQDPNGNRITAGYSGSLLNTLTHSSGQTLTFAYSGSLLQSITDSLNRTTSFSYDAGQHLQTAAYYDGSQVVYSYVSGQGAGSEHALAQIAYPGGTHQYFTYDSHGRPAAMSRDGGTERLTFGYEGGGNVGVTDAYTNTTRFYLDHRGLLAKALNPLTNALRLVYDTDFNLTSITDPAGRSYGYSYDYSGNLTGANDPLGNNSRFLYGALNRLATLTDAKGNTTRYMSDSHGNLAAITYPDNSTERWRYDGSGNPTTWTNRRANGLTYQFNAGGQLTAKLYPDGRTINYRYNTRTLLTNITDSVQGVTRVAYDAREFVTNITYPDGRGFSFTYDPAGRRTGRVGFDGYALNYAYDPAGRLATLTDGSSNQLVQYTYDADGRLSREAKGNGTVTAYGYNKAAQLVALTNSAPGGAVQSFFNYGYDSKGNRLTMTTAAGVTAYAYDDLNQLVGVKYPNGREVNYTYDGAGNRKVVNDTGTNTAYTVNNANEYTEVGGTTYGYDADGNMTNRTDASGTTTYQFDAENRLVAEITPTNGTWQYIYDGLGNRSAVVHDGVTNSYLLDPFELVDVAAEYDAGGGLVARYAHGLGLVERSDSGGNAAYYSFDALGNTRQLTGVGGVVLNSYDYDAFGATIVANESLPNAFRFIGRFGIAQGAPGLLFARARFYDVALGRFITAESSEFLGTANLYTYADNDPVNSVDPDGYGKLSNLNDWAELFGRVGQQTLNYYRRTVRFMDLVQNYKNVLKAEQFLKNAGKVTGAIGKLSYASDVAKAFLRYLKTADKYVKGQVTRGELYYDIDYCFNTVVVGYLPFWQNIVDDIDQTTEIATLGDPNQLTGPAGYGPQNYVQADNLFSYRIDFEITNALALPNFGPAQVVIVSDPLTNTLNWTTLQFTEVGFGSQFFAIPPGTQHYEQTAHVTYSGVNFDVRVEAGLNPVTGVLTVSYQSIDPHTGLPPQGTNGIVGFLQPEDGTGRGMGHVSFLIRPKPGLPTGTAIRNVATVAYDPSGGGPTYRTDLSVATDPSSPSDPSKQALATIDADIPTSSVASLPAIATNATFAVSWTGTDIGSGVAGYDVYVQTNYGPWNLWLANTPLTSTLFQSQNGRAYCFYSLARDGVGLVQTNQPVVICTQTLSNYPPVIDGVTNRLAFVGSQLVITNHAYDADGVTFSLDPSAPAGSSITTNGIFSWSPACAQGSTTNLITIWVADNGTPRMSSSVSFLVTVPECIEAGVGNTILLTGQTSSVPVRLLSTTALTNMAFTLVYPGDRFTNFALTVNSPQVLTQQLRSLDAGSMQVSFTLPASSILHGPTNIGLLSFAALSNQSSAFVPLLITNVTGLKAEGGLAAKAYGQSGRVVVVGPEPLLEAGWGVSRQPLLTLYGKPGSSYAMEWRTNLMAGAWQFGWRAPMTNLFRDFGIEATKPSQFYRAYEFFAEPPILEIQPGPAGSLPLLFYGRRGTNYVLESSPALGSQAHWLPQLSLTLSNSFDFLPPLPMTNRSMFFRAFQP